MENANNLFDYYDLQPKDRKFWQYHQDNPYIYHMFKRFTQELIDAGHRRFGAKGIFERIRWETYTNTKWEPLKVNNNYTAGYARLFEKDFPQYAGFFRTRKLKSERNEVG